MPVRDASIRRIEWRDLLPMTRGQVLNELTLSLPWLLASLWCYDTGGGWVVLGMVCSFFFFLTGLRQSHGCQHYQLPIPRRWQDAMLAALSVQMLSSMHAVQATHLNHHRHTLDEHDFEGSVARQPMWRALLTGPLFPLRLHWHAWRLARPNKRRWIAWETLTVIGAVALLPVLPPALRWHVAAMLVGECFVGFFAVWTVHHGCDEHTPYRTQRGRWTNRLFYNMFLHTEHHLFPAVPTCKLHLLAQRIDAAEQRYRGLQVLPGLACRQGEAR
ncbi:MAG: fatty acid desaturase [Phycisphaerales bacterium JB063]